MHLQGDRAIPAQSLALGEMDEVVYRGPVLTLLLPVKRTYVAGHARRSFEISSTGLTCWQLLSHVYDFYQVPHT